MFTTYNVNHHPEVNPLIGTSVAETAANCASALRWVIAIDINRLCDQASEDGLFPVIYPILTALECSTARDQDCFTLDPDEAARLRALAEIRYHGNVRDALDVALGLAEIKAAEPTQTPTPEEMAAIWRRIADQAAAELAKLNTADQGEQEGCQ